MMLSLLLLFPQAFSKPGDLPKTKHIDGGIFGWANALALQRNIWSSLSIPDVRFDKSDINVAKITKELISGRLDINLTQIIQDMINSMQENLDSDENNETVDEEYLKILAKNKFISAIISNIRYIKQDDVNNSQKLNQCTKDEYPNAYLISKMLGDEFFENVDCKVIDDFIGQIMSYAFISAPLLIITILSFLFYFFFFILRCCCCKVKERTNPGAFSIVCFIIVLICLFISLGFSITSSAYLYKIVDYIFSKKVLTEAETVCNLFNSSIGDGITKTVDELVPSIQNISDQIVKTIDNSLPKLTDVLNSAIENIFSISDSMNEIVKYGVQMTDSCTASEDKFNTCIVKYKPTLQGECKKVDIENISIINEYTDFDSANSTVNDLNSQLSSITDIVNISSFIDTGKDSFINMIDQIQEQVSSMDNISISTECNLHSYFDFIDNLPSFIVPIAKLAIFLFPLFMFILIVSELFIFVTKNCCSRCLSLCCVPCCICTLCQLLFGLIFTMMLVLLLFMNIFVNQGDDALDTIIKEVTNEDKIIDFGTFDLTSMTDGIIGKFPLDSVKLRKIHFIKNFVYSDLDSTLSKIVSMSELPFEDIATMIEIALINAAETTNIETLIVGPIYEAINETKSSLPESNLVEIANMSAMSDALNVYSKPVENCYSKCSSQFSELSENYNGFFDEFSKLKGDFENTIKKIEPFLNEIPQKVALTANEVFGDTLKVMGKNVGETLRLFIRMFDGFDMRFLIGAFNIVRVRLCYNFFTAVVCFSISAHLFVVGMTAMSLLVWIRRKGMSSKGQVENSADEDSGSLSDQSDEGKTNFGGKEKVGNENEEP